MEPAKKLATYDDLLALAEGEKAEVIHGALVVPPAPLPRHSGVQGKLRRFLGGPFDDDDGVGGPGGWWIFLEVDVRISAHDIVKDPTTKRWVDSGAFDATARARIAPFEAVELDLSRIFPPAPLIP